MNEVVSWWDIAQKIGSGAAFVMGIGLVFLWKAYVSELKYSKDRDTQTLTVLLNLTKIVEAIEERDKVFAEVHKESTNTLMGAIKDLGRLIESHYLRKPR